MISLRVKNLRNPISNFRYCLKPAGKLEFSLEFNKEPRERDLVQYTTEKRTYFMRYEECRWIAEETGTPLPDVYARIIESAK